MAGPKNSCITYAAKLVGGMSELARMYRELDPSSKVAVQHVSYWCSVGAVKPEHAAIIEYITNGAVTRNELCPSVFERESRPVTLSMIAELKSSTPTEKHYE